MVWTEVEGCPCDLSDQSRSLQGRIRKNNIMRFTGRAKGAEGRVRTIVQRTTRARDGPERPDRLPPFSSREPFKKPQSETDQWGAVAVLWLPLASRIV